MLNDFERTIIKWEQLKSKADTYGFLVHVKCSEPPKIVACQNNDDGKVRFVDRAPDEYRFTSLAELEGFVTGLEAQANAVLQAKAKEKPRSR
jgi:hypothetical protein